MSNACAVCQIAKFGVFVFLVSQGAASRASAQSPWGDHPRDTANAVVAKYGEPYLDLDEWRDKPVRHRYVHGGFRNTAVRFIVAFPPKEQWRDRFAEFLQGGWGGYENSGYPNAMLWAFENGAYYVESNQGHIDGDLTAVRGDIYGPEAVAGTAEPARYSLKLAREMYGREPKPGVAWGSSSGSNRASALPEVYPELFAGVVLVVMGQHPFHHFSYGTQALAEPILRPKVPAMTDAIDAGGSGDPYSVLDTDVQKRALHDLYRAGYPRGMEWAINPPVALPSQIGHYRLIDPTYFSDFWTKPGYAGTDGEAKATGRVVEGVKGSVRRIVRMKDVRTDPQWFIAITLRNATGTIVQPDTVMGFVGNDGITDPGEMNGMELTMTSGKSAGKKVILPSFVGDVIELSGNLDIDVGDTYVMNDRDAIAMAYYQRYLVDSKYPQMRQYFKNGKPTYPQRDHAVFEERIRPGVGVFSGKVILMMGAHDVWCWPSLPDFYYLAQVRQHLGKDFDNHVRIYFMDRSNHLPIPLTDPNSVRLIQYTGLERQGVAYLFDWTEKNTPPPPSTNYKVDDETALILPASAKERRGFQPVATATADGHVGKTETKVGSPVQFDGVAELPTGIRGFVRYEWDFEGKADWSFHKDITGKPAKITVPVSHTYGRPGTYFATLRVGAVATIKTNDQPMFNLARVRVIVKP